MREEGEEGGAAAVEDGGGVDVEELRVKVEGPEHALLGWGGVVGQVGWVGVGGEEGGGVGLDFARGGISVEV